MKFRTELNIEKYPNQIDYNTKIYGLGSCFVDNIKAKLDYYQFQNRLNPFGTIFNPVSIKNIFQHIVHQQLFTEKDLFFHQSFWKSFELHSKFNQADQEVLIKTVNNEIQTSFQYLQQSQCLFITLGTAWIYRHKKSGVIVSNCHKIPQSEFDKQLLSPTEIIDSLKDLIQLAKKINPNINILMSISPIRHLKDGFIENQRSKAHLLTAVHQVIDKHQVIYFPSYEIMLDDLRDYRFYKNDFLHPNDLAVDYIWEKFQSSLITPQAYVMMQQIDKIRKALQHKSFQSKSRAEQKRLHKLQNDIKNLKEKYTWISF